MNHVQRQNQGRPVEAWNVTTPGDNKIVAACTPAEAARECDVFPHGIHPNHAITNRAQILASAALSQARAESARGRR